MQARPGATSPFAWLAPGTPSTVTRLCGQTQHTSAQPTHAMASGHNWAPAQKACACCMSGRNLQASIAAGNHWSTQFRGLLHGCTHPAACSLQLAALRMLRPNAHHRTPAHACCHAVAHTSVHAHNGVCSPSMPHMTGDDTCAYLLASTRLCASPRPRVTQANKHKQRRSPTEMLSTRHITPHHAPNVCLPSPYKFHPLHSSNSTHNMLQMLNA